MYAKSAIFYRTTKQISRLVMYILLMFLVLVMIYPLIWLFFSSFKENYEIFGSTKLLPSKWITDSYIKGWKSVGLFTFTDYFINTFKLVLPTVLGTLISSFLAAYGFARFKFKGKKLFFSLMLSALLLPDEVLIVPKYLMYKTFGWLNTYKPFIIPAFCATYSFFIFLLVQFIRGIPKELDESAEIDGASNFTTMVRIILPQCKPAMFSVIIFQFVWRWNDFFTPLLYINSVRKYPVSLALRLCIEAGDTIAWNQAIAMSILAMLPPVIIYIAAQKWFVEGVVTSGIKE